MFLVESIDELAACLFAKPQYYTEYLAGTALGVYLAEKLVEGEAGPARLVDALRARENDVEVLRDSVQRLSDELTTVKEAHQDVGGVETNGALSHVQRCMRGAKAFVRSRQKRKN
jgi:hypothetical protein